VYEIAVAMQIVGDFEIQSFKKKAVIHAEIYSGTVLKMINSRMESESPVKELFR
jgi:hypothetical protein